MRFQRIKTTTFWRETALCFGVTLGHRMLTFHCMGWLFATTANRSLFCFDNEFIVHSLLLSLLFRVLLVSSHESIIHIVSECHVWFWRNIFDLDIVQISNLLHNNIEDNLSRWVLAIKLVADGIPQWRLSRWRFLARPKPRYICLTLLGLLVTNEQMKIMRKQCVVRASDVLTILCVWKTHH